MSLQCVFQGLKTTHQTASSNTKKSRGLYALLVTCGIALTPACAHQGDNMTTSPSASMTAYGVLADQTPVNQVTLT